MKEISNRQLDQLIEKLPSILALARGAKQQLTLRQYEDIRQIQLLHSQLKKKKSNFLNNKNHDKK